ncbi:MAG: glycosyltransferase family 2 protein, partial [Planctomycetaceae bacterium]|nr:glycosyltransferase family 2 protein [Planctomycetaceae bacterium]
MHPPPHLNRWRATPLISVVAPVFNEADGIRSFTDAVAAELNRLTDAWEIVLVDDGSSDGTWEILQTLHADEPRIKILRFSRNFGHQLAITAGMQYAKGDAVIVMDADLQHPPALIPQMVAKWKEGFGVVYTVRSYGNEIGWFKRTSSNLFYRTLNVLSDTKLEPGASDFRLLDRTVLDQFNAMPENVRFIRGMIRWLGFRQTSIPFTAAPRFAGQSKFSLAKMVRFALEGITSFSVLPLRWITACGLIVAAMSICYAAYVLGEVFLIGNTAPGWASLIVA